MKKDLSRKSGTKVGHERKTDYLPSISHRYGSSRSPQISLGVDMHGFLGDDEATWVRESTKLEDIRS